MTTNSTVSGYLVPGASPAPLEGTALENFFQEIVVGITGMDPSLVRPRWQPEPPDQPDFNVSWASLGIINYKPDVFAVEAHNPTGDGSDYLLRTEELELLVSFYGPSSDSNAAVFRDGLQIEQNRFALTAAGMGLISTGDPRFVPDLVKDRWVRRLDVSWGVRRQVQRNYPILNLLSADGTIYTDTNPQQVLPFETPIP